MCELMGLSSAVPRDIRGELQSFYQHSIHHPHGWGLMWEQENGEREIIKEPVCATGSRIINDIMQKMIPQKNAMAHIRLATVGSVDQKNCHPFMGTDSSGRQWTLIHNGTIYSSKKLTKYLNVQIGDTDSERVFLYLLDEINRAQEVHPLTDQQRFQAVEQVVIGLSRRNKLNLILYDGELMYVHQNMQKTLYYKAENRSILFSTVPLDQDNWEEYPLAQLLAFRSGEKVFEGTVHGHVFVPTLDFISASDAMHI